MSVTLPYSVCGDMKELTHYSSMKLKYIVVWPMLFSLIFAGV